MEGDAGSGQLNPTPPVRADSSADQIPKSRLLAGRRLAVVVGGVAAASVLVIAGGAVALVGHQRNATAARGEAAAVAKAKDCIIATHARDATGMAENQRTIVECSTDTFAAQAALYGGILADAYRTMDTQIKVSDIGAAAERHNPDGSINVLVALRVSMSDNLQVAKDQGYRLRVRMVPDSGTYKVDNIESVSR